METLPMTPPAENVGMLLPDEPPALNPSAAVLLLRILDARVAANAEAGPGDEERPLLAS
jgi:hypothetical protein